MRHLFVAASALFILSSAYAVAVHELPDLGEQAAHENEIISRVLETSDAELQVVDYLAATRRAFPLEIEDARLIPLEENVGLYTGLVCIDLAGEDIGVSKVGVRPAVGSSTMVQEPFRFGAVDLRIDAEQFCARLLS